MDISAASLRGSCGLVPFGFTLCLRKLIEREEATRVTDTGSSGGAGAAGAGRESGAGGIRNVVLVGHSGSGKTTLAESLLLYTGTVARAGRVEDGSTTSDFDEVEIRQKRSVNLALTPFVSDGITVNLLDTPGYADFTGDLRAGLRAADCALVVVEDHDRG